MAEDLDADLAEAPGRLLVGRPASDCAGSLRPVPSGGVRAHRV